MVETSDSGATPKRGRTSPTAHPSLAHSPNKRLKDNNHTFTSQIYRGAIQL